jgi:hypothetical protein
MKKINYLILFIFVTLLSCTIAQKTSNDKVNRKPVAEEKVPTAPAKFSVATVLQWDKKFVEYGKVKKGEKRETTYTFTNVSKEDIKIEMCSACDCTTLDWTRRVLKPGEKGTINAIFNSAEKDEQETIPITIILENRDPIMHYPIVDEVKFHFDIEK